MATKNEVKKAKKSLDKLRKKRQIDKDAEEKIAAVDKFVKEKQFDQAMEAITVALKAVELCPSKGAKKKNKEASAIAKSKKQQEIAAKAGDGKPNEPTVEQTLPVDTIEAIAADGVKQGLSGADLVKYALTRLGQGAGAAVVEAESAVAGKSSTVATKYRTHNCAELRTTNIGAEVSLVGWVSKVRLAGQMLGFVDLRDRYGITQCVFQNKEGDATANAVFAKAKDLGREFCIRVCGICRERSAKNGILPTGFVEILVKDLQILTHSKTPPFLIEDDAKCGEDLRLTYRYLDIRRNPIKNSLLLRNAVTQLTRNYLNSIKFCEVETPVLIKSTPEGARDFIVPSRLNPGQWYALPQSPQTFKQILMVSGMDRYFQIAKCFRDEDLRPDRQLEFTQIDCEMSFVEQEDVLNTFEGLIRLLFRELQNWEFPQIQRLQYSDAMRDYGIDKPDLRFGMLLHDLTKETQGHGCPLFDESELVLGIAVEGCANFTKAQIQQKLTSVAKEYGVAGMATIKCTKGYASTIKKFFSPEELEGLCKGCEAKDGDLVCIFWGKRNDKFREMVGKFRHHVGSLLGLRSKGFHALWVVDFPLVEWNEEQNRYTAMHHPFTSCKEEDRHLMATNLGAVRANAYDLVINGVEVGGGSIRIHDKEMQHEIFKILGFTREEAQQQFGFILGAFEYGAPPHGGLAFGLDRLCTLLGGGSTDIRDFIAFPKNTAGRDMMIDSPSWITKDQMEELNVNSTCEHTTITTRAQWD
jgi:aspartyl-tRNA synthetase